METSNLRTFKIMPRNQCSGSMTFWGGSGSGSADPCPSLMDPDPDPGSGSCYFVIDPQDASKKLIFNTIFSAYYFLKVHLHHFSKIKSQKESQNSTGIKVFSYYFCMMIEGSGSGSIPLTSGSGSGRPKNMWIRWFRIRIRIRVRNTARTSTKLYVHEFAFCTTECWRLRTFCGIAWK
jgi:hypothetical protein